MARNIVVLLDGTANALTAHTTNLPRLYKVLEKTDQQLVYYDPGVGTFEGGNSFLSGYRKFKEILGMATGWGLDRNVKQAYRYLCQTTGQQDEITDDIYLMGFSRGAHTARVLAGFIHNIGLLRPDQMHLVDYAFDAYRSINNAQHADTGDASARFQAVDTFTKHLKPRPAVVRCVAVFDTVSSMVEFDQFRLRLRPYSHTNNNPSVKAVRHAVGIDERRIMFKPALWGDKREYWGGRFRPKTPARQDVEEVWFSGVHADVGGGYREPESGLAKLPLKWMLKQLEPMGLQVNKTAKKRYVLGTYKDSYIEPNALAAPHDSMNSAWEILEYVPFKHNKFSRTPRETFWGWYLPKGKPRYIKAGSKIHSSVFERRGTEHDYDQPNIPQDHLKA